MKNSAKLERDGDYLFWQAGALIEKISLLILLITFIDLFFETEFLVDQNLLNENKSAIITAWGKIVGPITFLVMLFSYLRIRLPMDIKNEQIPFFQEKSFFKARNRREVIQFTAVITFLGFFVFPIICQTPFNEGGIFDVIHIRTNIHTAVILETLWAIGISSFSSVSLSSALILEKSYRFYEIIYQDLEKL